jgi:hypothetical protein
MGLPGYIGSIGGGIGGIPIGEPIGIPGGPPIGGPAGGGPIAIIAGSGGSIGAPAIGGIRGGCWGGMTMQEGSDVVARYN